MSFKCKMRDEQPSLTDKAELEVILATNIVSKDLLCFFDNFFFLMFYLSKIFSSDFLYFRPINERTLFEVFSRKENAIFKEGLYL